MSAAVAIAGGGVEGGGGWSWAPVRAAQGSIGSRGVASLIDPGFLTEARVGSGPNGVDFAAEHRLLGRPVCRAAGCSTDRAGRRPDLPAVLVGSPNTGWVSTRSPRCPREQPPPVRGPGRGVDGCAREWESRGRDCAGRMESSGARCGSVSTNSLAARRNRFRPLATARSPPARGNADTPMAVLRGAPAAAAGRPQTRSGVGRNHWQATEPPIGRGGEVSLRGLPPLVVAEVLVGLQQRCRIDAVKTREAVLRALCNDVRHRQVDR